MPESFHKFVPISELHPELRKYVRNSLVSQEMLQKAKAELKLAPLTVGAYSMLYFLNSKMHVLPAWALGMGAASGIVYLVSGQKKYVRAKRTAGKYLHENRSSIRTLVNDKTIFEDEKLGIRIA